LERSTAAACGESWFIVRTIIVANG
jgi:hypothetical protein